MFEMIKEIGILSTPIQKKSSKTIEEEERMM